MTLHARAQRTAGHRSTTVDVAGGAPLAVHVWGPSPATLFCIHGFGDGAFVWEPLLRSLGPDVAAIAPDLRGHGHSSRDPQGAYSAASYMREVGSAFEHFDLQEVVLVGHSLGAILAAHLAVSCRQRVRALIVVDSGPELRAEATQRMMSQFRQQRREYASNDEYIGMLAHQLPLSSRASLEAYASAALRPRIPRGVELRRDPALRDMRFGPEAGQAWEALKTLDCPVLLVRGEYSAVLPSEAARRFAAELPRGRLATVPMAGHALMLENPAGFQAAVGEFLSEIGQRSFSSSSSSSSTSRRPRT